MTHGMTVTYVVKHGRKIYLYRDYFIRPDSVMIVFQKIGIINMTKEPDVIEDWINRVQTEGRNLSKWEENFMESIQERFERTRFITDRQEEILERIYTETVP